MAIFLMLVLGLMALGVFSMILTWKSKRPWLCLWLAFVYVGAMIALMLADEYLTAAMTPVVLAYVLGDR